MFKALSRLFGKKTKAPRLLLPVPGAIAATTRSTPIPAPEPDPSSAKAKWEKNAAAPLSRQDSPETLAGITPDMTHPEILARLAKLYQRHNRAASSFDPKLREEAEFMLETLAGLREKYARSADPAGGPPA